MDRKIFMTMMENLNEKPADMNKFEEFMSVIYNQDPGGKNIFLATAVSELLEFGIEITNYMRNRDKDGHLREDILEEMADATMTVLLMKSILDISNDELLKALEIKTARYVADKGVQIIYDPELKGPGMYEAFRLYKKLTEKRG